jgi:hypothetical protein
MGAPPSSFLGEKKSTLIAASSSSGTRTKFLRWLHAFSASTRQLGPRFVFRGLDEVHAHSGHATNNRSFGGIADVLRPAF